MTEAERRAFIAGYKFGTEDQILAHDGLLAVLVRYETAALLALDERPDLTSDPRITAVMGEVRRRRFDGGTVALAVYELEMAMEGER
jgi:hypothetical protein